MKYTHKNYTFIITDYMNDYGSEYHRWHMTHFNGAKIQNKLSGTMHHATTYAAHVAAKEWIDRQPEKAS